VPARTSGSVSCDNEHAAFVEHLFARYRSALHRHVGALLGSWSDAEDIVQETYLRLLRFEELERIEARARSYMFRIATNLAYDRHRRPREQSLEALAVAPEGLAHIEGPEAIVDLERAIETLCRTLLQFKPRCRRVFLLRSAEGLSYEAIAERLGISKRTVEREMKHALDTCQRRLRRTLE
jgi:RNA polymerase sigma-19 factor, ECF subfamily